MEYKVSDRGFHGKGGRKVLMMGDMQRSVLRYPSRSGKGSIASASDSPLMRDFFSAWYPCRMAALSHDPTDLDHDAEGTEFEGQTCTEALTGSYQDQDPICSPVVLEHAHGTTSRQEKATQ